MERLAYSTQELAEAAGVCERTVVNQIRAGRIRAKKIGRRTVILASDAREWLESADPAPVDSESVPVSVSGSSGGD